MQPSTLKSPAPPPAPHSASAPLSPHERRWVAYCFAFMLIIGVTENLRSALMPLIKAHLGVSDQGLSGLIMMGTAGSVLFQLFSGPLIARFGHLRLYHASCLVCVTVLLSAPTLKSYAAWLIFFLTLHSGFTLFSLATNTLIPRLGARAAVLLNLTHGCYGLGAMLSPLAAEHLLARTQDWRDPYTTLAACFGLLWIALTALTPRGVPAVARDLRSAERPSLLSLAADPAVRRFGLLFGAAISAEVATSSWMVQHLYDVAHTDRAEGARYLSAFFALFTLGRLLGGPLVRRLGERRAIRLALSAAALCLTCAALSPARLTLALPLSGLCFSVVFPSLVILLNASFERHQAHILGVVASSAFTLYLLFNGLIGLVNDLISPRYPYALIVASLLIALATLSRVHPLSERAAPL
jgi:fucose permease